MKDIPEERPGIGRRIDDGELSRYEAAARHAAISIDYR